MRFQSRFSSALGMVSSIVILVLSSAGVQAERVGGVPGEAEVCRAPREVGPSHSLEALLTRLRGQEAEGRLHAESSNSSGGVYPLNNRGYNYAPTPMATLSPTR
ncbi:hypothetical protein MK489_01195 [Myxococcota bacterium]|nr:hypothetical protein [Myxococcota bacterium]